MASEMFEAQVALLVRVLPYVATEACFALKGGTAINLFVRDLPRLSVDIDLVYLPIEDRETSLNGIRSALSRIAQKIRKAVPDSIVTNTANGAEPLSLFVKETLKSRSKSLPYFGALSIPRRLRQSGPS